MNSISVPTFYVLFEDSNAGNWRIQAVPQTPTSFSSRKSLPKAWCGLRDDVLSKEVIVVYVVYMYIYIYIWCGYSMYCNVYSV